MTFPVVWWPDTAPEYVGLAVYAVLAAFVVRWLAGVDTNAVFLGLGVPEGRRLTRRVPARAVPRSRG